MSKGDWQRPIKDKDKFNQNWDRIFPQHGDRKVKRSKKQVYHSKRLSKIKLNKRDQILCAKFRKGHFEGVIDVMDRLTNLIKPIAVPTLKFAHVAAFVPDAKKNPKFA